MNTNKRIWIQVGVFGALALAYLLFFTDWLRPEPIEIVSQIRYAVQNPHFGRPVVKKVGGTNGPPQTNHLVKIEKIVTTKRADEPILRDADGDVAHVTFTLDDAYRLTHLRVEDVPADGSAPKTLWLLKGKSWPTRSLVYGVVPQGMLPVLEGTKAEPLKPEVPYRLIVEAGRRRGTNNFRTVPRFTE